MSSTILRAKTRSLWRFAVLIQGFLIALILIAVPLLWLYNNLRESWGEPAAEALSTVTLIIAMGILVAGIILAYLVDRCIRHRRLIFADPKPGCWAERILQFWGYCIQHEAKEPEAPTNLVQEIVPLDVTGGKIIHIPEKPMRLGRRPDFPVEDWIKVALRWELRDPQFDTFSLSDVICQELGTSIDGSPIMSEQSYYKRWRLKAVREINRRQLTTHLIPEKLRKKSGVKLIFD